ncbi:MAG: hypothetical protein K0U65_02220 [Gammaproteobacteria bacterium]|nr:hypothetical protein [Gammaproteobacteria bacterium]MTI52056.1 hypothetical protein [Alcanivorax sp.]
MSSTSYGYSVDSERRRVIGLTELAALVVLVAVVCWLVFPRDLSDTLRNADLDAVTLSYSTAWLKAKPDDHALRLVLARDLIELGRFAEADTQLDYVAANTSQPSLLDQLRWLRARLPFVALMAIAPAERGGSVLSTRARVALSKVQPERLETAQLQRYAEMALILGNLDLAVGAYHLLAVQAPPAWQWHRKAGDALLARGRYARASEEYILAMRAQQGGAGRADFLKAVTTLQAGGLSGQALDVAARWEGVFLNDSEVLYRLMSLARAAGEGARAQHYAVLLLRLRKDGVPR